jgi:hypothetical protein
MAETERRGPGQPRKPAEQKVSPRPVRLDLEIDDALCRLSNRHGISVHALLKLAARMLVESDPQELARRLQV